MLSMTVVLLTLMLPRVAFSGSLPRAHVLQWYEELP